MSSRTTFLTAVLMLGLASPTTADPLTDLLNQAGLTGLISGGQGGIEIDVLNPVGTGDNDLLGLDLFTPDNGLGLTLAGTEMLGFGNTTGSSAISLDFLGLDQLTQMLGLAPDSALVAALRNTVGPDGALVVPVVNTLGALSGLGDNIGFDFSEAIGLPGISGQPVGLAIASTDSNGNATADGIAGVALLTPGSSGNGGLIGIAVISGNNSGNGDLIGLSVAGGDGSGSGDLAGIAVLGGDQTGNSQTLALSALSGSNTGNSGLLGIGALNDNNSGNGGTAGVGMLNDDGAGNGGLLGAGVLNGDTAGNGGFAGVSVINGDNAGTGSTAGVAVLSGDNTGNSDGIAGAILSGGNSGSGGGGSIAIGNDNNSGDDGDDGGTCEGVGCGEDNDTAGLDGERLAAASECAEGDADGDGVCDEVDECKDTPQGAAVFRNGCHLDDNTPLILRGVEFEFDSSDLTDASIVLLQEARDIIRQHAKALISIDGHTDAKGSERYNENLSYQRARTVYRYFVDNGIEKERLSFRGFGESVPIAANATEVGDDYPAGRALNRRVELSVVDQETFAAIGAEVAAREQALQAEQRRAQAAEARRRERARQEAAQAKAEQKKAEAAAEDYGDVLQFLEESGSADTRPEQQDDVNNSEQEDVKYSLEIIEPSQP